MKISEIIEQLQKIQQEHGDLPVCGYNNIYDEYTVFDLIEYDNENYYMDENAKLIKEPYVYFD